MGRKAYLSDQTNQRQVLWNFAEPTIRRHEFSQRKGKHITGIITEINRRIATPVISLLLSSVKDTADWEIPPPPPSRQIFQKVHARKFGGKHAR
jgi:hypothetical protein